MDSTVTVLPPPPAREGSSDRRSQPNRLHANMHPVTWKPIAAAVRGDGSLLGGGGSYIRLQNKVIATDELFTPYCPTSFPEARPCSEGQSAADKKASLLAKVRSRQKRQERRDMKARGNAEVAAVIESFIEAAEADDSLQCEPCGEDAASELFWESLTDHHDCEGKRLDGFESPQTRNVHSRGTKPDRRVRLGF